MDKLITSVRTIFDDQSIPVLVRDNSHNILYSNLTATERFGGNGEGAKCYSAIHGLNSKPAHCPCGFGEEGIKVARIYEPGMRAVFERMYIPIKSKGNVIGSLDLFKEIECPLELGDFDGDKAPVVVGEPVFLDPNRVFNVQGLTEKENKVLRLIMEGRTTAEIGRTLGISENTVNFHMKNVFRKLEVENRTQAAAQGFAQAIKDSDLRLKEMNHRIKNNLAMLFSMVELRLRLNGDPQAREALTWVGHQIRSIALFHDLVTNIGGEVRVPFRQYVQDVVRQMREVFGFEAGKVRLRHEVEDCALHMDIAVPCILIINELVTNAVKHAFGHGEGGTVEINFSGREKTPEYEEYELIVRDNGTGLKGVSDTEHPKSLGLTIVLSMVKQIGGTYHIKIDKGTEFVIRFRQALEAGFTA